MHRILKGHHFLKHLVNPVNPVHLMFKHDKIKPGQARFFIVFFIIILTSHSPVVYYYSESCSCGRSTSSTIAIGALSPARYPHLSILKYPPGRSL